MEKGSELFSCLSASPSRISAPPFDDAEDGQVFIGGKGVRTIFLPLCLSVTAGGNRCSFVSRGLFGRFDPLHRQPKPAHVPVAGDVDGFEVASSVGLQTTASFSRRSTTLSPSSALMGMNFTSNVQPRQEILDFIPDFGEPLLAPVHQIHFVDGDDDVRDAEQRGEIGVPARLLDDALGARPPARWTGWRWKRR